MSEKRNVSNFRATDNAVRVARRKKMRARRMLVKGSLLAITTSLVGLGIVGCKSYLEEEEKSKVETTEETYSINTTTEDLSTLNVVLVNDGISDNQMDDISLSLQNDGLDCKVMNIDEFYKEGNECFISFIPYQGDDIKIAANTKDGNNHADLLAIAASVSFKVDMQKGIYDQFSSTPDRVPTDIEKAVGDQLMPNVSIVIPEDKEVDQEFTDNILETLARYSDYFVKGSVHDESLLLRPTASDYTESLDPKVLSLNNIEDSHFIPKDSILKAAEYPECFKWTTEVSIDKVNVKGNSLN